MAMRGEARWRIILAAVLVLLATLAIVIAASILSKRVPGPQQVQDLVNAVVCLGAMSAAMWLIAHRWLRLNPSSLGTRLEPGGWRRFLVGLVAGVCLGPLAFSIALLFGGFRFGSFGSDGTAWLLIAIGTLATGIHAVFEEIAFRAGLVGILKERVPPAVAVLAPAVLFGVMHLKNEGAGILGAVNGAIVGSAFGLLYLAGRHPSLAVVSGLHFGWNEVLYRMGIPVSGTVEPGAFMSVKPQPNAWSGFDFGLEGSPATTMVFTAVLLFAYWQYRKAPR